MIVNSLRLGQFEISDDKVIFMEKPVLGFEHYRRYCLVEVDEIRPLLWLQSLEDSAVAFLVVNPRVFSPDYKIEIVSREIAELDITRIESVETYVIVTVTDDPQQVSINLQGPILINTENNRGKQLVLVNTDYKVKHKILDTVTTATEDIVIDEKVPVEI